MKNHRNLCHGTSLKQIVHVRIRSSDRITPVLDEQKSEVARTSQPINGTLAFCRFENPLSTEMTHKSKNMRRKKTIDSSQHSSFHLTEHGSPKDEHMSRKQRKRVAGHHCCTLCCKIVCVFACLLFATGITALVTALLTQNRASTTETTSTLTRTTTTTTTPLICGSSCLNRTWISTANLLAKWRFDGTFVDDTNTYPATPVNNPLFISNGYVQQGVFLNRNSNQYLYTSYIPLIGTSFTVEAWLYPMSSIGQIDFAILGLCTNPYNDQCLHLTIRNASTSYRLYMSFFGDNILGHDPVPMNQWIHVAFTFENQTHGMSIYLNGKLSMYGISAYPLLGTPQNVTIGYVPKIVPTYGSNYFHGYMDHITISNRAKPACEILEDASLAAYYNFDHISNLDDSAANSLNSTSQAVSLATSGHLGNALSFQNASSFLQVSHFTGLGINDQSFSISLWIRPVILSGTLVFVSQTSIGSIWCFSFMGFATNGSLVAQVWTGVARAIFGPAITTSSTWHHIVQTWSLVNGLRLYIDNTLVAFDSLAIPYQASSAPNYVMLANRPINYCASGAVGTQTYYTGDIDEFRIYSRELTADDVCALYFL